MPRSEEEHNVHVETAELNFENNGPWKDGSCDTRVPFASTVLTKASLAAGDQYAFGGGRDISAEPKQDKAYPTWISYHLRLHFAGESCKQLSRHTDTDILKRLARNTAYA